LGQTILEVGCGIGNFTGMLLDREAVIAIDSEPDCIARLRERYPDARNLTTHTCEAGSGDLQRLGLRNLDSCVCLNVLEHIEDDRAALEEMAATLAPSGVIVLIVPAFPALFGPIDLHLGHYRRYTRRSLHRVAEAAGLRIAKLRWMNSVGFFGWWWNARVFPRNAQSEAQIDFFDRRIVPVLARVEHALPPPFGQSLFAVLRKP
jgi:SAM-dependent methyltransferase